MTTCPCCGQSIRAPRRPAAGSAPILLSASQRDALSTDQLLAYFKQRRTLDDCIFFQANHPAFTLGYADRVLQADTAELLSALQDRKATAADDRALQRLKLRAWACTPLPIFPCGDASHRHTMRHTAQICQGDDHAEN